MNHRIPAFFAFFAILALVLASCATGPAAGASQGATSPAKAVSSSGSVSVSTGIPLPGKADKPKPAGNECNLKVLDWAGFEGAASYSFDDGQPSQLAHWKELKALEVPLTFYLMSSNATSSANATWKDALAAGSELGNHTATHKQVSEYKDDEALAKDVDTCAKYLTDTLGVSGPVSFAYPFGDLSWKDALGDRFLLVRSVYSGTISPLDDTDPLILPIYPVTGNEKVEDFNAILDQNADDDTWVIFMFHSLLPGANWFAGIPAAHVTSSLSRAKQAGRLWLDTVENIGSYWMAQKILMETEAAGNDSSKTWSWTLPKNFPKGKVLRVKVDGGTLSQGGKALAWNDHGFYEVSLDAGSLDWKQQAR